MGWYYAENQSQVGPIDEATLLQRVADGLVNDQTYLWRDGLDGWKFFSELKHQPPFSGNVSIQTSVASSGQVSCIGCSTLFPQEDCLSLSENRWVCAACKPKVVQQMKEGVTVEGALDYAGFLKRLSAKIVDGILLSVVTMPLTFGLATIFTYSPTKFDSRFFIFQGLSMLISIVIQGSYSTILIGKYGATWGKMAVKIRVVRADGSKLTYKRACGRYFAELLSSFTLCIGYLMAAFDQEHRALHDRICDTRVVLKKE